MLVRTIIALALGIAIGFTPVYLTQTDSIDKLNGEKARLVKVNEQLTADTSALAEIGDKYDTLEAELSRILLNAASGGGLNMKYMPHPETGEASVALPEVFSFDANHAFCRVDTNKDAFIMPTYEMGDVLIEKNEFFMAMSTTSMDEFKISKDSDGNNTVTVTGGLDCLTEVAKANMTLGSREVAEFAEYKIKATDGGLGGGKAGDTFEFTVYFDKTTAPVNYAIFGPEFTFTGEMIDGEITIPDPR
jgi:hypothetical protein